MYKHILIPTDGSETAEKAVAAGIEFARDANARITWFTAVPEYEVPGEGEVMSRRHVISLEEHNKRSREQAEKILAEPARKARAAGIACATDYAQSNHPYEAIIAAATRHGCDLIFMSSHGRKVLPALFLGSATRDVLSHSTIPTLVYR
jgi:nucleotide-binding universal stress UspA family protein